MKRLILLFGVACSLRAHSQETPGGTIDIGFSKYTGTPNVSIALSYKRLFKGIGLYSAFLGRDQFPGVTQHVPANSIVSGVRSNPYGGSAGVSYSFGTSGLTLTAGCSYVLKKTVYNYQDGRSLQQYCAVESNYSPLLLLDYDILRKMSHLEAGVRGGYDLFMGLQAGVFVGYKFSQK